MLRVVQADWRWLNRDVHGEYDAIICLGNSFTHLFSERDRRKALAEFYAMLSHDGVLILDQRNYDSILDDGFSSKHKYYYSGDTVTAEPEYLDDGLARFRYTFHDDGSVYHLNMFPLRKEYVRRLMREVGFQKIDTYGDFQDTYGEDTPDFWIHVAEKTYRTDEELADSYSTAVHTARDYYNSADADTFYHEVWGGEDIHVGLYESPDEPIAPASARTVERMAETAGITADTRVLDMGAGYGGAARHLARKFGCRVTCLNLSEVENERNREKTREQGLDHLVDVVDGSFENMPIQDNAYDLVWSQDAFLHSGERSTIVSEIERVLVPSGQVVFTDPMAADGADVSELTPILARLHLDSLGSPGFYRERVRPARVHGLLVHRPHRPADDALRPGAGGTGEGGEGVRRQDLRGVHLQHEDRPAELGQRREVRAARLGHLPYPPLSLPGRGRSARGSTPTGLALQWQESPVVE